MVEPKYFNNVFFNMLNAIIKTNPNHLSTKTESVKLIKSKLSNDKCISPDTYDTFENKIGSLENVIKRDFISGSDTSKQKHLFLKLNHDINICINLTNILICLKTPYDSGIPNILGFFKPYEQKLLKNSQNHILYIQKDKSNKSINLNELDYTTSTYHNISNLPHYFLFHRDLNGDGNFAIAIYQKNSGRETNEEIVMCTITGLTDDPFTTNVLSYAFTTDINSKQGKVNYDGFNINLIPKGNNCFKVINQSGGVSNPKAKVMHTIRLNIARPDTFIIGKYNHPRAPYIVLPAKSEWITRSTITFPTRDGKKLVVYKKSNRLIAPTTNNTFDEFIIKHIVKKRAHTGGALTMVVDGSDSEKCVALTISDRDAIILTKRNGAFNNEYTSINGINATFHETYLQINSMMIPTYNVTNETSEIMLYKNPNNNNYILGVGK